MSATSWKFLNDLIIESIAKSSISKSLLTPFSKTSTLSFTAFNDDWRAFSKSSDNFLYFGPATFANDWPAASKSAKFFKSASFSCSAKLVLLIILW